jgi:hypothetical protein
MSSLPFDVSMNKMGIEKSVVRLLPRLGMLSMPSITKRSCSTDRRRDIMSVQHRSALTNTERCQRQFDAARNASTFHYKRIDMSNTSLLL